ncbi:beta-galactosidase [Actinoplanes sp. NPDC051494]|uniref:beta-galactosidase n=1 Tax=Actinoplanes sp. NPDC051494 TaxID=3363907 RepID=UPI0037A1B62D
MATDHPAQPLVVRHHPWTEPLRHPAMSNEQDVRPGIALTSRYLIRDGSPIIPVSGEMHYSRVPRDRWAERLRQMRAGGVTVVATYVLWLHHAEHRDQPRFDGNLDIAAFVDEVHAAGLDIILRIGPWVHSESRNGGFPDWVQQAPVRHRTDDPAYLDLVREWFGQLGAALEGRASQHGTVLGIQLENELYTEPQHLVTLKRLSREAGMSAPLWTATAWGGADLPPEEVLPLYGGYGDGFWVDSDAPWDPSFRDHYFFSHVWDDPGIGADVRRAQNIASAQGGPRTPSELFPPATCELAGGMGTAYHRRPRPSGLDTATVGHNKIGNGSAWQGYYMYTGGTNPAGDQGMQESHATGYPNDMQRLGYDFHAPIGEAGVASDSYELLRRQHAFLRAFGPALAEMPSSLPVVVPAGVDDSTTLRWALRSNGDSGFLFLSWHQPHIPLDTYRDAQFQVTLDDDTTLVLPSRPIDIPVGTLARWPLRFHGLDWVTATALTLLPGDVPTLVLTAEQGIEVEASIAGTPFAVTPGLAPTRVETPAGPLDLLVLDAATAAIAWVGDDRLLLSADELAWGPDGRVTARSAETPTIHVYDVTARAFTDLPLTPPAGSGAIDPAGTTLVRPAGTAVPVAYGKHDGRQSAPTPEIFDELAAVHRVELPAWAGDAGMDALVEIDWAGDIAELRVDGRTATDRFWDGTRWLVNLRDAGYRAGSDLTLHILPLATGSTVHLPDDAHERLLATEGQLLAVDSIRVIGRRVWHEAARG